MSVLTFGESMVLLVADPGMPLRQAQRFRRGICGAESNVAIGLARLGHPVGWFGRVGADAFGDVLRTTLRGEGVDARVRVDPDAPTGLLIRDSLVGRAIEVAYYRHGSAGSRLGPEDLDPAWFTGVRWLHVTGITPALSASAAAATWAAIEYARAAGGSVCFDPNLRRRLHPPEVVDRLLRPLAAAADLVLAGADEANQLAGTDDARDGVDRLLGQGPTMVVLKQGARGAWATDGRESWTAPVHRVPVTDLVGAGDAFAAGLLGGLLGAGRPAGSSAAGSPPAGSPRAGSPPAGSNPSVVGGPTPGGPGVLSGLAAAMPAALADAAAVAALSIMVPGDCDGLPTAGQLAAFRSGQRDVLR